MRIIFKGLLIFGTLLGAGCGPRVNVPDIKFEVPQIDIESTCNKKDSELPLTEENRKTLTVIQDAIEIKDVEVVDCKGVVISKYHGDARRLDKDLKVEPPANLSDKVNYVEITNVRTCVKKVPFEAKSGDLPSEGHRTSANQKGDLTINFSNSTSWIAGISTGSINVREGLNVIQIIYNGKCLKRKSNNTEYSDMYECEKAVQLAKKEIVIEVKIQRTEAPGTAQIKNCSI
ncbi:MAG: hypothetical protein ACXWQE_14365 [Bdellovibrionales bacterium]